MQIAKSRRTLRINSGAGPEGRKEDPREIGKSKCRDSCGTRSFNLFDGPLVPSQLFLETVTFSLEFKRRC